MDISSRILGSLRGGAVGDALGYVVEFTRWADIKVRFGEAGLTGFEQLGSPVPFSDDTQMTLFTVDGLAEALQWARDGVGADELACIWLAYLRWYRTQGLELNSRAPEPQKTWLERQEIMNHQQAPGQACLSGLASPEMGTLARPVNPESKGCGTIMRSAPFGLIPQLSPEAAYSLSRDAAALTHGHPSALQSSGHFARLIQDLVSGMTLAAAVDGLLERVRNDAGHAPELLARLEAAVTAATGPALSPEELCATLGEGWVAEEAFAIALYSVLATTGQKGEEHFRAAIALAINHDGDSDSTGSLAGNILGAHYGETAIPGTWLERTTGIHVVDHMAAELTRLVS